MDNRSKQAAFKARMREKGLAQVTEWIPVTEREQFKGLAEKLRKGETVTTDKVTSNEATTTASADWLQPLADRAAFVDRIKQTFDYPDLLGLAVKWWIKTDPATISTEEALDGLAFHIHDELDEVAVRAGLDPDETIDRFVRAIRQAQLCRMDERQEQETLTASNQ